MCHFPGGLHLHIMDTYQRRSLSDVRAFSVLRLLLTIMAVIAIAACSDEGDASTTTDSEEPLQVVTTTNIVADWARNVGGDRIAVMSLLPAGSDPHTYQPGARDVARIADSNLVLTIGLNLEDNWLQNLIENASVDESRIVILGDTINPIAFEESGAPQEEEEGEEHGPYDPHFWFDPNRVANAVTTIAEHLADIDPAGAKTYRVNAAAYATQLDELHTWTLERMGAVPANKRVLVTSHDSLSYFAVVYGFEVIGTVIVGGGTDIEPSAEHVGELAEIVKEHGVPAVFGESTVTERIARTIAEETGAQFVPLYSGSLGPEGSGAETHIGMVRTNVNLIIDALS